MANFGDLSSKSGLDKLNEHLKSRSYVEGVQASKSDASIFGQIKAGPNAKDYPYLSRWFNHIKSFGADVAKFPAGQSQNGVSRVPAVPTADDDDIDLFASDDEEDEEAAKVKEQRLADYAAKKSKKPALVAKSNVIFDVKPWDDETKMAELEKAVRSIEMEGLLWGASKLVPVGYGINKLQIATVIQDDLVSVDELTEKIESFEDFVQSVDIAAFNKI